MEQITIGQIAVGIAFIVALIGGVKSLKKFIKEGIESALKDKFDGLEKSQKDIIERLDAVELENCKTYLITFLSEVERGGVKNEIELQQFWEKKKYYNNKGGNSYINHKTEELQKKGYL